MVLKSQIDFSTQQRGLKEAGSVLGQEPCLYLVIKCGASGVGVTLGVVLPGEYEGF